MADEIARLIEQLDDLERLAVPIGLVDDVQALRRQIGETLSRRAYRAAADLRVVHARLVQLQERVAVLARQRRVPVAVMVPLRTKDGHELGEETVDVVVVVDPEPYEAMPTRELTAAAVEVSGVVTYGGVEYPFAFELEVSRLLAASRVDVRHAPVVVEPATIEEADVVRDEQGRTLGTVRRVYPRPGAGR